MFRNEGGTGQLPPATLEQGWWRSWGALYLHILTEEEGTHVRWGGGGVGFQQLAGSYGLLIILLALPVIKQRLEHVQTVVYSPRAQQRCCSGAGDEGGRLKEKQRRVTHTLGGYL